LTSASGPDIAIYKIALRALKVLTTIFQVSIARDKSIGYLRLKNITKNNNIMKRRKVTLKIRDLQQVGTQISQFGSVQDCIKIK
jgi:hypothetical protein